MMVKRDIRLATLADLALMHEWVNSDDSLKWKKNTNRLISTEEHTEWFQSRLADPVTQIWIILDDAAPSGQVRLEKKGDLVYVDIYVVAGVRGTGLAGFALNESINRYTKLFGSQKFCAIVNPENEMSEKLFVKNGFQKDEYELENWIRFIRVER